MALILYTGLIYRLRKNHTGNVVGTLLYAQTGSQQFDLEYPNINGNRYLVKTLDLNVDFEHLKKQLDEIVDNVFFT